MSKEEDPRSESEVVAELERRLKLTYEAVSEGIWDWDLRNDDLVWSDRFIDLVGLDRKTFTPRYSTFSERLHPDDRERIEQALQDHIRDGKPYDVEYRLRHESGDYLHIHALGQAFWDDAGNPLRMVGSVEDITDKVRTRHALNESETRFQQLAANIPGAIFRYIIHPDGSDEIEYMSPGCLDIWEVDADTIQGDPTTLWEVVMEEDFPAMRESVVRAAETLAPWAHKWRIVTRSGRQKWLHGRGLPSRREDGSILFNSLILDITEQTTIERELAESREMFHRAQRMDSLGQLTGGMAHDFNNLLGIILGNLELLRDVTDLGDQDEYVNDALNAVYRGSELTRSLLAFARRATLEPEPVQFADVIRDLEQMLRHTLPENIRFETRMEPDLPSLIIDRGALESTLLNLIINARDAIETDGTITLSFSSHRADDRFPEFANTPSIRIQVQDTGSGIDPEILSRVVEPFFTTKASGKGTGLGMSMVEGFVKQSGGALHIDSEPGVGTTINLLFPLSDTDDERLATRKQAAGVDEGAFIQQGTILVVEDEEDLRKVLCNRLEAEGYSVYQAANGNDALGVVKQLTQPLDLLLTDFIMPGSMQGPDVAAALRDGQPDIAVVYLSGYVDISSDEGRDEYLRADARLFKPIGKIDLLRTVRQVLIQRTAAKS